MTWYTYMLRCSDDTLYSGVTTDPRRRLEEHNHSNAKAAKYTRVRRPVLLVYQQRYADRSHACKAEAALKKLSRIEKEKIASSRH